ncbi:hypothetical protein HYV22_03480 [Candidatus Gottesmanbacteria bacterium]|nr:hypothetical protein [Candidatus Gottesmanbacteria bacterium]
MKRRTMFIPQRSLFVVFVLCMVALGVLIYGKINQSPSTVLGTTDGTTASAKEFFVPFGFGTVEKATDWTDVPGMRATINSSLYPKIKQVILEVTPRIADDNQTVWVRLRNYDGYSYPSVSMDGKGPDLRLSPAFSISPGEKTYYIQAKTSGGSTVQIYQARLHITTY